MAYLYQKEIIMPPPDPTKYEMTAIWGKGDISGRWAKLRVCKVIESEHLLELYIKVGSGRYSEYKISKTRPPREV